MDPSLPGEVELTAGRDFPISPQIKGAIKSLSGVVEVQDI
jgi:DNA polymerase-3 subunit alpha